MLLQPVPSVPSFCVITNTFEEFYYLIAKISLNSNLPVLCRPTYAKLCLKGSSELFQIIRCTYKSGNKGDLFSSASMPVYSDDQPLLCRRKRLLLNYFRLFILKVRIGAIDNPKPLFPIVIYRDPSRSLTKPL